MNIFLFFLPVTPQCKGYFCPNQPKPKTPQGSNVCRPNGYEKIHDPEAGQMWLGSTVNISKKMQ
jgi:hypothetical protein